MAGVTIDMRLAPAVTQAVLAIPLRLEKLTLMLERIAIRLEGGDDVEMAELTVEVRGRTAAIEAAIQAASDTTLTP